MPLHDPMDVSYGLTRRPKRFSGSKHFDYPPAHPGTGSGTNVYKPRGFGAPLSNTREDVALDQRMTERRAAFIPRLPLQGWLRARRTVQVTPLEVNANKLTSPYAGNQNYGGKDFIQGPIRSGIRTQGGAAGMSNAQSGYTHSATESGMYNRDYSLQTQMGTAHVGALAAAPQYISVPGYTDLTTTQVLNGQYSVINQDMAQMYLNLRAPAPFESLQGITRGKHAPRRGV